MPKFLKLLFADAEPVAHQAPRGRRAPVGRIVLPGGKSFAVVREDILRAGIERTGTRRAA